MRAPPKREGMRTDGVMAATEAYISIDVYIYIYTCICMHVCVSEAMTALESICIIRCV